MATSGKLTTSAWAGNYGTRYFELSWSRVSFDNATQTTTIKWALTSRGSYTGYIMCQKFSAVIDGETVYESTSRREVYPNQTIASGTKTLKHNIDGTKSFAASAKAAAYTSSVNCVGSATFALDALDASTVVLETAPNFNDEQNPTIKYRNPVGSSLTSLQAAISLDGSTDDIAYRAIPTTSGTYTFNLTNAERKLLRQATTGSNSRKVYYYLRQVINGGTYYTKKQVTFSIANYKPTITAGVVDTNETTIALTGDDTTIVKYHSIAHAVMNVSAKKEATITAQSIESNGKKINGTEAVFKKAESDTFTFSATDSRNNTVSKKVVAKFVNYIKPTINIDKSETLNTEGNYNFKVSGNYYNGKFGTNIAALDNTITVKCRYKQQNAEAWGAWMPMETTLSGNTYTAAASFSGLDYRTAYTFKCVIQDKLNIVYSAEYEVVSLPVFHWSATDFAFEVPVSFNAGANIGNAALAGKWQPTLTTAAAVASYTVREGWYMKIGNVVVVGWQLKATINSGYNSTALAISGLPYKPTYAAFGGGIAHNAYLSAGFCFEGYAAGTDGNITLRGQPCNNTTAANLQITSTAYYPTGSGNVLTLAGCITYYTIE